MSAVPFARGSGVLLGVGLVVLYTGVLSGADAITKMIAATFDAPQLYAISGLIVVAICVAAASLRGMPRERLATTCPRAMGLRSLATIAATIGFFNALHMLPLAQVFVFIGLMPILAGLMSGPILGEQVRPAAWIALAAGFVGMLCLFPAGLQAVGAGHVWALLGAVAGTFSLVLARFIARFEQNTLAQVFYPNLALGLAMALALPFFWRPMTMADLGWVLAYAGLLFLARWLVVLALRQMAAYVVVPLLNVQFVWMVALGAWVFGEWPAATTILGAAIIVASGVFMVWDQMLPGLAGEKASGPSDLQTDP
ncbi:MAG: DMT family transporter [Rhodobacteraceae bacterium]|nr:MAG: DMT family transporter [Paracoccaceae bacterium]